MPEGATAVCRNASSSSGHVKLVFSAVYGDVLFFPASQVTKWPPGDELKPPEGVGKQSRGTSVTLPLAALHGGVLRYYGSASLRRASLAALHGGVLRYYGSSSLRHADVATVSAGDFGNSGRPASSGFCCCADKDCASCKAPPCEINFEVTTCQDVPGFTCKDFVETAGSGPVGWVMAIIVMVGVFLVGGTIAGGTRLLPSHTPEDVGWVMAIIVMVGVFLVGGTIAGVVYFGTVPAPPPAGS
ncbi:hypothetical protein T484DRAFT_1811778 [Baffinella frigidus]|nr:hypothetical protein T484DRAFT_1811778 [Cryptophyta sp. CCMP2293]